MPEMMDPAEQASYRPRRRHFFALERSSPMIGAWIYSAFMLGLLGLGLWIIIGTRR